MEMLLAVCLGVGLSAACGFRIFVPMLIASLASKAGMMPLGEGFHWISSDAAMAAFLIATFVEVGAFYLPWLDNALDSLTAPAAMVAGILLAAASMHSMPPMMKWSIAVIAGGGSAGVIHTGVASLRLGSTAATGGLANPVVSTIEWIGSIVMSLFSIFLPLLAALLTLVLLLAFVRLAWRVWRSWRPRPAKVTPQKRM